MDTRLKEISENLRKISSSEAANWLMESYPIESGDYDAAITLMAHRSWKRADQIRLANYYLQNLPYASSKVYEVFVSFMGLKPFLRVVNGFYPQDSEKADLLVYHLRPVLRKAAKTESDQELVEYFFQRGDSS